MAYIKKIWKDYPDSTTPIIAADMNNIENGIEAVDNVTKYITATAASNGDFKINISNTLTTGMIVNISFPTPTNSSSNARLSINNGTTYYNIISKNNHNLKANMIANQAHTLYFNGTNFMCLEDIVMYSTVTFHKGGTDQVFSSDTYNNVITW